MVNRLPDRPPAWVTDRAKCWGRVKDKPDRPQRQCKKSPKAGSRNCDLHAGGPVARAHAEVRAEVALFGLGGTDVNPGDTLLQLLSQAKARVVLYSTRMAEVVDHEYEGDLAAAMVGDTYVISEDGRMQKVGEYIRGLAQLESQERDRCARYAEMAIKAGLEQKRIELAQEQGRLIAGMFRMVLTDPAFGLTPDQRAALPALMRRHLAFGPPALPIAG